MNGVISFSDGSKVNLQTSKISDYIRLSREIDCLKDECLESINISFLSTYSSELLDPYFKVEMAKRNFRANLFYGSFNNIEYDVFNFSGSLYSSNPDVIFIHSLLQDILPDLILNYINYSSSQINDLIQGVVDKFHLILTNLRNNSEAIIILSNFSRTDFVQSSFADGDLEFPQKNFFEELNRNILKLCCEFSSCYIYDYESIVSNVGHNNFYDWKLFYISRFPFSYVASVNLTSAFSRLVSLILRPTKKCLVVDLDNTIWGGVLGEVGVSGIHLGDDFPGNIYKNFQKIILGLHSQGVLLAIASKNNEHDVLSVFKNHSDCVLQEHHFLSLQINWDSKVDNIKVISNELRIGLDSIVFFDDNPVERDWVKSQLPMVNVVDVPDNAVDYSKALLNSGMFDRLTITNEDRLRPSFYQHDKVRNNHSSKYSSLNEFISSLKIIASIDYINSFYFERVIQLISKTNQFNLTTKRYQATDLTKLLGNGAIALVMSVKDRFGDIGIVGLCIAVEESKNTWRVDVFLISCRAIGRQLESVLLGVLINEVKERGGHVIIGQYIETKSNLLAQNFYHDHGFEKKLESDLWLLDVKYYENIIPEYIEVNLLYGN